MSGLVSSGVAAVAVPTCDCGGQLSELYASTGHTFAKAPAFGPRGGPSVTFDDFVPASPGCWVITVVRGGFEPWAVCPSAPTVAVSLGANGSASQAVGMKLPCPSAAESPSPTTCSVVAAGPHDVGFRVNGLPAPLFASSVR